MQLASKKNIYWYMVILCGLMTGITTGTYNNCNSIFTDAICSSLNITKTAYSISHSLYLFICMPMYAVYAALSEKFGYKKIMIVCSLGCTVSRVVLGASRSVVGLYLGGALFGLFQPGSKFLFTTTVINRWFSKKKGLALGVSSSASAIISISMIQVMTFIFQRTSWRTSYYIMSVIGLTVLSVVWFFVKEDPAQVGLRPLGWEESALRENPAESPGSRQSLREVILSKKFLLVATAVFLVDFIGNGVYTFIVSYLTEVGYTVALGSLALSAISFMGLVDKMCLGRFYDKKGVGPASILICSIGAFSVLMLLLSSKSFVAYALFAATFCVAYGAGASIKPWASDGYFGAGAYAMVYSLLSSIGCCGGALGNLTTGVLYDFSGSYRLVWVVHIGAGLIALGAMIVVAVLHRRQSPPKADPARIS